MVQVKIEYLFTYGNRIMSNYTLTRIQREYKELMITSSDYWTVRPKHTDNMYVWEANIHNLQDPRHTGMNYSLEITLAENHPFQAPVVRFIDKVRCENVYTDGTVCIDILQDKWSPAMTISRLMITLCSVLTDPPVTGRPSKLLPLPRCSHSTHPMETRNRSRRAMQAQVMPQQTM